MPRMAVRAIMVVVSFVPLAVGCAGSAKVNFIALHAQAVDPPPVEPFEFHADRCFWWVDESGRARLVMHCRKSNLLLGQWGNVDILLAFDLEGPPAGSGRDFALQGPSVRISVHTALQRQRFSTVTGIMSMLAKEGGVMQGSFRIWLNPMREVDIFSLLPQRPGPFLCYGTYRAVNDARAGMELLRLMAEEPTSQEPTTQVGGG